MSRSVLSFCFLTVSALALCSGSAQAQNYVRTDALSGPNVVIDFGALDQASMQPNQWSVGPTVQQQNLEPPAPAPKLQPPVAKQAMVMTPVSGDMGDLPPPGRNVMPASDTLRSAAIMPARPLPTPQSDTAPPAPTPMAVNNSMRPQQPSAPVPAPTNFAARDMLDSALPAPQARPTSAMPAKPVMAAQAKPAPEMMDNAPKPSVTPKDMLAAARSGASDSRDRVNLASISDGPPLPIRTTQPAGSYAPSVAAKPVMAARPAPVAAPKPAVVMPAPKVASAPVKSAPLLPPSSSLDDLNDMATAKPAAKPVAQPKDDYDVASLPSSVKPQSVAQRNATPRDLDNEDRPASAAMKKAPADAKADTDIVMPIKTESALAKTGEQVSLRFTKDAGTLDDAAKKDLDSVIKTLKKDSATRAQIRAYASGTPETSGQARRLSLTRALAARSYVLDQNIPATRLDIRALGNGQNAMGGMDAQAAGSSMDRVDVTLVR